MTSYQSKSLHIENQSGTRLTFTTPPERAKEVLRASMAWEPSAPDQRAVIYLLEEDARSLHAFLGEQLGIRPGISRNLADHRTPEEQAAWAEQQKKPAEAPEGIPAAFWDRPASDFYQDDKEAGAAERHGQCAASDCDACGGSDTSGSWGSHCPDGVATCKRTDSHHHMLDSTGVHWVHDGTTSECPLPDNHYPLTWDHPDANPVADVQALKQQYADTYGVPVEDVQARPVPPSDNDLPGMWSQSDFTGGQDYNAPRQCPTIYSGVQCTAAEGHDAGHRFPGYSLPAPEGYSVPQPDPAEADQPAPEPEKPKRKRRTKLEIAYDEAKKAYDENSTAETGDALSTAYRNLREKDPGNERLSETIPAEPGEPSPIPSAPQESGPSFAPEPLQPGAQPVPGQVYAPDADGGIPAEAFSPAPAAPAQSMQEGWEKTVGFAAEVSQQAAPVQAAPFQLPPFPGTAVTQADLQDPGDIRGPAYAQMEQAVRQEGGNPVTGQVWTQRPDGAAEFNVQAAQGFPCPTMHSDGVRQCTRPYGHEIATPSNPEPKPHIYASDPATLGQPAGGSVVGPQPTAFQVPPTPPQPAVHPGTNLQPPAPAAPFWQQPQS